MKGNTVLAAAILALGLVIASVVLVVGLNRLADSVVGRLETTIKLHGQNVERASVPVHDALTQVSRTVEVHASSVERAGVTISRPSVIIPEARFNIADPVRIQGTREDGALPVNARLAK